MRLTMTSMDRQLFKKIFKVLTLCVLWYSFGSASSIVSKTLVQEFPYPQSLTFAQFSVSVAILSLLNYALHSEPAPYLSWRFIFVRLLPLGLANALTNIAGNVSIWRVPVSYTHTVKAMIPIFTVLLSKIMLQENHSYKVYLSLLPIVSGVLVATVTEVQFDKFGLLAALLSTIFFSWQNVYTKKVLSEVKMHPLYCLLMVTTASLVIFSPFWLIDDLWSLTSTHSRGYNYSNVVLLLIICGILKCGQSVFAFSVLSLMTPTSYSVANSSKRIVIIAVSIMFLKNPVTYANVFGMALATLGVFCYNKIKFQARLQETSVLPTHLEKVSSTHGRKLVQNTLQRDDLLVLV